ncbi:Uncharacterized protein APZ42_006845 [Daphnia magna]|uniref:Uncharacterized protein n=1 Tax=Daphnia magna TaxID=35525 RepID=A0A164FNP4_9CRUS|nr:Uncharacterized protein APZ42_006845 [Daphnia magna]
MKQRKDLPQVLHLHHVTPRNNAETQVAIKFVFIVGALPHTQY